MWSFGRGSTGVRLSSAIPLLHLRRSELGGGIVVMDDGKVLGELQLQIAGIMSEAPLIEVNEALENAKEQAFKLGVSRGVDPFMTLSFMALTVIPTLRLTTRGVFDVINQRYV